MAELRVRVDERAESAAGDEQIVFDESAYGAAHGDAADAEDPGQLVFRRDAQIASVAFADQIVEVLPHPHVFRHDSRHIQFSWFAKI